MLVSRSFAFVHMPKTGGSWIVKTLLSSCPKDWSVRLFGAGHMEAKRAPADLKSWVIIRNPWDWYVSTYFFHEQAMANRTGAFAGPHDQWAEPALQWEIALSHVPPGPCGFAPLVSGILNGTWLTRWNLRDRFNSMTRADDGTMLCGRVGRFENLRSEVLASVRWAGEDDSVISTAVMKSAPFHVSDHARYGSYYTPRLAGEVGEFESDIVKTYGYTFEP